MNQRYPQQPNRGARRPYEPSRQAQGDERFDRPYDPRAGQTPEDWEDGGRVERMYGASADYDDNAMQGQYLGSYPTEQGPRYYSSPREPYRAQRLPVSGAYGPEDFRQGSGQRQWQGQYGPNQQNQFARQGQRQFTGMGARGASNADMNYGYGNYRQAQTLGGYSQGDYVPESHERDYGYGSREYARGFDEGDFGQSFGGYSPSQGGYGQSYSGYGRGGYGSAYGQGIGEDMLGTSRAAVQTGAFGQGPGGYGGGFSQGLAGRGGYGVGSGYTRPNEFQYGMRESQFGKGPKGYTRSDERIREGISERLLRDHDLDASDILVEVRSGTVTLSGAVDNRQLKHYVEDLVERCAGVQDIDNRLTVRPQGAAYAGQAASTGTTGSRTSTASPANTTGSASLGGTNREDGGAARSKN
jgi:hypothetical protein